MDRKSREMIVDRLNRVGFALQDLLLEDTQESLEWALDATRELHQALEGNLTTDQGDRENGHKLQPCVSDGLHRR